MGHSHRRLNLPWEGPPSCGLSGAKSYTCPETFLCPHPGGHSWALTWGLLDGSSGRLQTPGPPARQLCGLCLPFPDPSRALPAQDAPPTRSKHPGLWLVSRRAGSSLAMPLPAGGPQAPHPAQPSEEPPDLGSFMLLLGTWWFSVSTSSQRRGGRRLLVAQSQVPAAAPVQPGSRPAMPSPRLDTRATGFSHRPGEADSNFSVRTGLLSVSHSPSSRIFQRWLPFCLLESPGRKACSLRAQGRSCVSGCLLPPHWTRASRRAHAHLFRAPLCPEPPLALQVGGSWPHASPSSREELAGVRATSAGG